MKGKDLKEFRKFYDQPDVQEEKLNLSNKFREFI